MAAIVPTTRDRLEVFEGFKQAWNDLFVKHDVTPIVIMDGDEQYLTEGWDGLQITAEDLLGKDFDLIYKKDTACKNLGLYYCALNPQIDTILIFDDDTRPIGDPIQDHLDILGQKTSISWYSTANYPMRGFPYGVREEARIVVSHGVWEGVPDLDAPTQLVTGIPEDIEYGKDVIPRGILFPFCGMNVALLREAIPTLYFAPPWGTMSRCDDIFGGILMKRELDKLDKAVVTGFARVFHERASNVFKNLQKESLFIELNETFWKGDTSHPYFSEYLPKFERWKQLTSPLIA